MYLVDDITKSMTFLQKNSIDSNVETENYFQKDTVVTMYYKLS